MRTTFPEQAEKGMGLAFGAVSEAVIGWGWPETRRARRSAGRSVALLRRKIESRRGSSFWWFVFGVWLSVMIYHSVRNTTFSFLATGLYGFVPVVIVVKGAASAVRTIRRGGGESRSS